MFSSYKKQNKTTGCKAKAHPQWVIIFLHADKSTINNDTEQPQPQLLQYLEFFLRKTDKLKK